MKKHLLQDYPVLQDFPAYRNLHYPQNPNEFTQLLLESWVAEDFFKDIEELLNECNSIEQVVNSLKEIIESELNSEIRYEEDEFTEKIIGIAKSKFDTKLVAIRFISDYLSEYFIKYVLIDSDSTN